MNWDKFTEAEDIFISIRNISQRVIRLKEALIQINSDKIVEIRLIDSVNYPHCILDEKENCDFKEIFKEFVSERIKFYMNKITELQMEFEKL